VLQAIVSSIYMGIGWGFCSIGRFYQCSSLKSKFRSPHYFIFHFSSGWKFNSKSN